MKVRPVIFKFNTGIVSPLALARVTEEDRAAGRVRLAAEVQTNWMPRTLGSMMLRPGLGYTGATKSNNKAIFIPFVKATDDVADVEFTDGIIRVWVDDAVIARASVSSAITNGTFDSGVASWTDSDDSGAQSEWVAGGYLGLRGTGFALARRRQSVTVSGGDANIAHAINIVVARGVVTLKVGTSAGGAEYFERMLTEGIYSLSFTPTASFEIELSADTKYQSLVNSIAIASSGNMEIASPYLEADLGLIRWEQSVDVIFLSCDGYRQQRIERYGPASWGLAVYYADDGPFRVDNLTKTTLTPSAVSGDITLTASSGVFTAENVGSLYKIGSIGQLVEVDAAGESQWSDPISVSGVGATRNISVSRAGTWSATVTLQRSNDEGATWAEVATYTTNAVETYNDALDNQDLQYRIGVDTGDFTSGTAELSLIYATGSLTGTARVVAYTSPTLVSAIVLRDFGGLAGSDDWAEGEWSDRRGFPTAITLYESRMTFLGRGKFQASESDAYTDFDPDTEGDAAAINKTIGFGAVDNVNWGFSGTRLVIGADGSEIITRQGFDEILSPANSGFVLSTRIGSARVPCAVIDDLPVFVQRCRSRIYGLTYDAVSYKYGATDLMEFAPDLGEPLFVRVAVQRQPDTRIHAVRADGKVVIKIFEPAEEVSALILFETDGIVEDVYVQPGELEDSVYYIVKRTINGQTVRYREKWALESECQGATLNKQADSFIVYEGVSTVTITGLDHLEGENVVVWQDGVCPADGDDPKNYTVSSGAITLDTACTSAVIGLPYSASWKSVKLAYGAQGGTALSHVKRIDHVAPILYNTHHKGLQFGRDFDNLWYLSQVKGGAAVATDTIHAAYDQIALEFDGEYSTDSRLCLFAQAPRPCTVLAVAFAMETNE